MSMQRITRQEAPTQPSTVYVCPRDFAEWIAPALKHSPALRARILREILKQPHAMIAVFLNPDWERVDSQGIPTRFELDEVRSLPRQMYADLVAHSRVPDNQYADRSVWRTALLKAAL